MDSVISELRRIHSFTGHPGKFWPCFLEFAAMLAHARAVVLVTHGKEADTWKRMGGWPEPSHPFFESPQSVAIIAKVAAGAMLAGHADESAMPDGGAAEAATLLAIRLEEDDSSSAPIALFLLPIQSREVIDAAAMRLFLVADAPAIYQRERKMRRALEDTQRCAEALDCMVLLNDTKRYLAAAMTLCNEVASRYQCERVSLGWLRGGYIRLQAVSHMESFTRKANIAQSLEAAMEEALDQDEEIVLPRPADSTAVVRDHELFAREVGAPFMASIPIRLDDDPVGVVTCERAESQFAEAEIRGLRILCDQAARRLGELREHDRWIGARMAASLREAVGKLFGVEHTFAKVAAVCVAAVLFYLFLGKLSYRVESPFILRSDNVRYLAAPFDGYIEAVLVKTGDRVREGDLLLQLDTRDLLLEESAAMANRLRQSREAEKARAENALAEMKIALALADQAKAQLDRVRYQLSRAEVRAPTDGVVVEGELRELLGAAVTKGNILFKVARIEEVYPELVVNERDIHEVTADATGEIAFVSQPRMRFPIEVERIDPVAVAKEEGNIFRVRCRFVGPAAQWWRPGMSGVAKITVGDRQVFWALTHRSVDFFRIFLWY